MKLAEIICFDAIIPQLKSEDRDGAINELIDSLEKAGKLKKPDVDAIKQSVIQRENEASTGIGKGVAVPHAKVDGLKGVMGALGARNEGIDFNSLDKKPVYSIILLLSPSDNNDRHLQAMECIFSHLQKDDFRKFLRQSVTIEQFKDVLIDADESGGF